MIKKYQEFINESVNLSKNFGLSYDDLQEILYEITDEFPSLDFNISRSTHSNIILEDPNSFIIEFYEEPSNQLSIRKIFNLITNINDKLKMYGLKVFFSDFGEHDGVYEIVVTKIGNTPPVNPRKYYLDDKGEINYK